jgi:putative inorganic carbon (HCO3(-)) transporter
MMIAAIRAAAVRVAAIEIWLVGLVVLAGAASTHALPSALGVLVLFWPIRWVATGRLTVRTPGDWAIGLLGLTLLVTLWATALPDVTQPQVARVAIGMALYYALANWAVTAARLRLLGLGLAGAGLVLALSAPFSVQWMEGAKLLFIPETVYRRLPRLLIDPIHPNIMAGALVLLLPCVLGPLLFARRDLRWFEQALAGLAAVAMLVVLVLTKSRGGFMGAAAGLGLLLALRWRFGWLVAPLAALAGGLAAWRIGVTRVMDALTRTQSLGGLDGRLDLWSRALQMIQDFPFTGIGMGAFMQVANAMYPFSPHADHPHAHNLFLQVAVDLGLPGLIAWLALFFLACVAAWRVYRWGKLGEAHNADRGPAPERAPDTSAGERAGCAPSRPYMAGLGAGLLASQVSLAVHGLTDAPTWGTRPAVAVWAVWGLAMAAVGLLAQPVAPGD